jgi:hypothetical protein
MSGGASEDRDEMVGAYIRHLLRGQEPPDLASLGPQARAELEKTFTLLDAIAGIAPDLVPQAGDDPVAEALGLEPATPATSPPAGTPGDARRRIVQEIGLMNRGALVAADEEAASLPDARSDLLVRVAAVRIRIAIVGADELARLEELLLEADRLFYRFPETAAVALVADDDELSCQVVEPQDCRPAVVAPTGTRVGPRPGRPELPLRLALTSYLDDIEPVWEEPEAMAGATDREFDVGAVAAETATAVVRRLKDEASRARITARRAALAALGDREIEALTRLVVDVSRGRISGDDIGERIGVLVGDAA